MPTQNQTNITVLISGSGTNLQALLDALPTTTNSNINHLPAGSKIIRCISNKKDAFGITRATAASIPVSYHNLLKYKRDAQYAGDSLAYRKAYDRDLAKLVLRDHPDLVVCAGFMHVLGEGFLGPLEEGGVKIINLHPALRAQYNGANAIERAHADFVEGKITKTGVMIHYVIDVVDMGDPILQIEVPLTHPEDDDVDVLKERIHGIEHGAIVEGTKLAIEKIWEDRKSS
ncbi:hypothetical protein BLS_000357 [Venturia inaequalis]|uniref:phosphoribosylglycinamide formyltransferase 1 n=1 Tax=Venturia inaequalis TaxID=5025 RepID=A0A8H3UZZ5_VENIN|nr:hypothetical protein BLS_000357 [Venturia inaequalis]KAE9984279.1 hypothetical protein EG328_008955 [Venturia inaequalis]KAE9992765.1 hypothetical protein EG327_007841 [Venturia inaequalis]RDI80023.1 Serine/threonine-protein kinase [Venturia inaequalis]